jgi:hypothetical protein
VASSYSYFDTSLDFRVVVATRSMITTHVMTTP